ncbi:MAG: shikimate kinase [Pseudomonadota bacterium]
MTKQSDSPASKGDLHITRPIVLVGLMGAGKSTTGRRLAQRLNLPFADADDEIEAAAGMEISDIFEVYGEAEFREGERKVMARLLGEGPQVLATGGGAFMNAETRALVQEKATSIWLKADLETHVRRTALRDNRPILRRGDPKAILQALIDERSPIYAQADITVESHDGPHRDTVSDLITALDGYQRSGGQI